MTKKELIELITKSAMKYYDDYPSLGYDVIHLLKRYYLGDDFDGSK